MSFARPEILRPPSQHASYYLPLTSGCSNNSCSFCAFSFTNLGIRELDEVKREIDAMSLYMNQRMWVAGMPDIMYEILYDWNGKRVFLQDGDALVHPYPKLMEALCSVFMVIASISVSTVHADGDAIKNVLPAHGFSKDWVMKDTAMFYDKDTVFDHIDGEAELYFPYGFDVLATATYINTKNPDLWMVADIYKMGSLLDAFGIYSNYRRASTMQVAIGAEGFIFPLS